MQHGLVLLMIIARDAHMKLVPEEVNALVAFLKLIVITLENNLLLLERTRKAKI